MNPGDRIKVITSDSTYEGVLMPQAGESLVIKLDSGYNLGIDKKKVKATELIRAKAQKAAPHAPVPKQDSGLPKIIILHTGGTIASKVDYEMGGVIARFEPEEFLGMFPEIKGIARIESRLIRNMWSEDMNFRHYNLIAREVQQEIAKGCDGIIVTHGTDTLHYTSAALSFMLQDLPIPVILVGSQRSSDRPSSDNFVNLFSAIVAITKGDYAGVAICMHEHPDDTTCLLLKGTKARKMHSSMRDAFKPVNDAALARIDPYAKTIAFLQAHPCADKKRKATVTFMKEDIKVALVKTHPHMHAAQFLAYQGYDGLLIEGFGIAGHVPINEIDDLTKENTRIYQAIEALIKSGTVVGSATQTIFGRVQMDVYSTGRKMQHIGMKGHLSDMHPETAFIKLAWLLSNYPKSEAAELFEHNLVGEITERTLPDLEARK